MRGVPKTCVALLVVAWLLFPAINWAQTALGIPFAWFEEPEHHADKWKVEIGPAFLTFNQRYVIGASATFPASRKNSPPADLHLILRVSDANGKWFEGSDYSRVDLAKVPPNAKAIQWRTDFFARAGTYNVVLLAYDATTKEHFLWRKNVTVDKPELLPELDRNLPQVEFINPRQRHAPVGEFVPIQNRRPLRIDVVLNLTGDLNMSMSPTFFGRMRQWNTESALVGAVSVLSQLKPANGCVRVSAIDIVHLEETRDRAVADPELDWQQVRETIRKNRDHLTVDVKTLKGRAQAREFFRQFLERVLEDKSGCGPDMASTDRAVIVVSDSLVFPQNTFAEPVSAANQGETRFFHVKISFNGMSWDQVGGMMSQLHPRHFTVVNPKDLRKAFAEIIKDLEKGSGIEEAAR